MRLPDTTPYALKETQPKGIPSHYHLVKRSGVVISQVKKKVLVIIRIKEEGVT